MKIHLALTASPVITRQRAVVCAAARTRRMTFLATSDASKVTCEKCKTVAARHVSPEFQAQMDSLITGGVR